MDELNQPLRSMLDENSPLPADMTLIAPKDLANAIIEVMSSTASVALNTTEPVFAART